MTRWLTPPIHHAPVAKIPMHFPEGITYIPGKGGISMKDLASIAESRSLTIRGEQDPPKATDAAEYKGKLERWQKTMLESIMGPGASLAQGAYPRIEDYYQDGIHPSTQQIDRLGRTYQKLAADLHERYPSIILGKRADITIIDEFSNYMRGKKMKFAPVAPYHIYQQFVLNGYIPNHVLLLAHDVVAHKQEYKETFEHPALQGTTIIMDNSAVELKAPVDLAMVAEAQEIVDAGYVVLPDFVGDSQKTLEATLEAWPIWQWKFSQKCGLMAIIQGETIQDWFYCAEQFKAAGVDPALIGIPRIAEGIQDSSSGAVYHRSQLVEWCEDWLFPGKPIHLFGFSDSIWEDLRAAQYGAVQSIDSAVPLRLESPMIFSEDAGPRGDWWEMVKFDPSMIERCQLIDKYINS